MTAVVVRKKQVKGERRRSKMAFCVKEIGLSELCQVLEVLYKCVENIIILGK